MYIERPPRVPSGKLLEYVASFNASQKAVPILCCCSALHFESLAMWTLLVPVPSAVKQSSENSCPSHSSGTVSRPEGHGSSGSPFGKATLLDDEVGLESSRTIGLFVKLSVVEKSSVVHGTR